ncbi:MAG TPA: HAMP domain-containing sensor histidine kinase [Candidatus Deferrimicrobium sp.]|nr:HAMP domain-containing sensor histidine kinase [Candidatus Deferrimicrobium sp.]
MNRRETAGLDVEKALGGAVSKLAATLREAPHEGKAVDLLASTLAGHALTESVRGCAVCVIDGTEAVRVAGVAGSTGDLTVGSVWDLAASPLPEVLAGSERIHPLEAGASSLGQALHVGEHGQLVGAPLRCEDDGSGGTTSLGALLLVRDRPAPLAEDECAFFEDYVSLAALALRQHRLSDESQVTPESVMSFLNLVVHDLRAPLTVLSGYVELLRDGTFGDGPPAWQKPMEVIAAKLHETHRLVDDVLLAARLESGAAPVSLETLDLNEVITRAAARSEARARLAGARVESVPEPEPVQVSADRSQVDRVVDNLINNAINYGGPTPSVLLSVDPADPPAIRVEDRGIGISPELHARVFERFFRIDTQVPGTGFGLHVGRVLAERCGGALRLERSVPGEGSVFRLELPAA